MGKSSSSVKNRYSSKAYDPIALHIKQGEKDIIKAHTESKCFNLNAFILDLVYKDINQGP